MAKLPPMNPAYQIPLTPKQLQLLGEITVILGQVDDEMVVTVADLLKIDRSAANWVMGSSKIGDNSMIWSEVIRNRTKDEDVLWLVEYANREIGSVSRDRNDFIHAVFSPVGISVGGSLVYGFGQTFMVPGPMGGMVTTPPAVARRIRSAKTRSVSELEEVRNQAARLSCLVAHINHIVAGNPANTSPWHGRLSPTLPPRLGTVASRKAKAPQGRRKSSRP